MKVLSLALSAALAASASAEVYFKEQFNDDVSLCCRRARRPPPTGLSSRGLWYTWKVVLRRTAQ